jgi:hypothetical protein
LIESGVRAGFCLQQNYQVEFVCWYTPDYSALWWPILHMPTWNATNITLATFAIVVFFNLAIPVVLKLLQELAPLPGQLAHGWRL